MDTLGPTVGPILVVVAAFVGIWLLLVALIWAASADARARHARPARAPGHRTPRS